MMIVLPTPKTLAVLFTTTLNSGTVGISAPRKWSAINYSIYLGQCTPIIISIHLTLCYVFKFKDLVAKRHLTNVHTYIHTYMHTYIHMHIYTYNVFTYSQKYQTESLCSSGMWLHSWITTKACEHHKVLSSWSSTMEVQHKTRIHHFRIDRSGNITTEHTSTVSVTVYTFSHQQRMTLSVAQHLKWLYNLCISCIFLLQPLVNNYIHFLGNTPMCKCEISNILIKQ